MLKKPNIYSPWKHWEEYEIISSDIICENILLMLKQINTKYLVSFQTEMVGKKRGRKFTSTVYRKIGLSLIQN